MDYMPSGSVKVDVGFDHGFAILGGISSCLVGQYVPHGNANLNRFRLESVCRIGGSPDGHRLRDSSAEPCVLTVQCAVLTLYIIKV